MKRITLLFSAFLLTMSALFLCSAQAQSINCNSAHDTVSIPGTALTVTCPTSTAIPPPVNPPPVTSQPTSCSASQTATIAGKTFQRQCAGTVYMLPYETQYAGDVFDLGKVLGGRAFPNYAYTGQSPTFVITSGNYVSLAFTPQTAGQFKLSANASYGDGGTISVSTSPGLFGTGAPGVICSLNWAGLNSVIVSTNAGSSCPVALGKTYYLNLVDSNADGAQLCFGAAAGSCASSFVSYQLSARAY